MNHIIMIKKILYRFLPVCLLVAGFSGCKDDTMEPLPETVPLIVEANAKSFVMGEKLILTIKQQIRLRSLIPALRFLQE